MYQVVIIYGESEPWWFFDDWQDDIVEEYQFESFEEAELQYLKLLHEFAQDYDHRQLKTAHLSAFWNDGDVRFCEECDDDMQLYHGLMLIKDYKKLKEEELLIDEAVDYSGKAKCCKRLGKGAGRE